MTETPWQDKLAGSMRLACEWLTQRSQLTEEPEESPDRLYGHPHETWRGTFREYDPAGREWKYMAPVWHTGQAVKALVLAHRLFPDEGYIDSARLGVDFIRRNVVRGGEDDGLILSYESTPGEWVRVPGNMECHEGLITFAEDTGEDEPWATVLGSLGWLMRRAYLPDEGRFRNIYDPAQGAFMPYTMTPSPHGGKPTIDGGSLFSAYQRTGERKYLDTGMAVVDRLVADERPPGNWACYGPSKPELGFDHPRHAYWYGRPMLTAHEITGDAQYLDVARRAAGWFVHAQRRDGGQFRGTYHDGKTDSFNHEFSGGACGAVFWVHLHDATGDAGYLLPLRRALDFLMRMQVSRATDPNMQGVVLSGVHYPDSTDVPRYKVRDLASIFFVQAAALLLARPELTQMVEEVQP